jgi:hypothetical protein
VLGALPDGGGDCEGSDRRGGGISLCISAHWEAGRRRRLRRKGKRCRNGSINS